MLPPPLPSKSRTGFREVLSSRFDLLLFSGTFTSGSARGQSIRLDLQSCNFINGGNRIHDFGVCIPRVEGWDRVSDRAFHYVVIDVGKEPHDEFDDLDDEVNFQVTSIASMLDQAIIHRVG